MTADQIHPVLELDRFDLAAPPRTRQLRGIRAREALCASDAAGWPDACQRGSLIACLTTACSETSTSVGTRRPAVRLATIGTTPVVWCCTRSGGNLAIRKSSR